MKSACRPNLVSAVAAEVSKVRWRRIAFWAALWWFILSAPTEDPFAKFRTEQGAATAEFADE